MLTVLVLGDPREPRLAQLRASVPGVTFVIGSHAAALLPAAADADAILVWSGDRTMLERVFQAAPRVRWVHAWSAGIDGLLFPALVSSEALLTNARGVYSRSLAEFALGAMLYFAKDFSRMKASQAARKWDPFDVEMLQGATLGIIGYGDIGRAIGSFGRAFGMNLIALRRRPGVSGSDPLRAEMITSKHAICERADYLALAAPITPETRHMLAEAELAAMKPTAVLINVGRGAVVDETALVSVLERGAIKGAALDVFEQEPLPPDHAFFGLANVLLSPHCADHTAGWRDDAMRCFLENLRRFRAGEELLNVVDKAAGY